MSDQPDELAATIDEQWANPEFREVYIRSKVRDWFSEWRGYSQINEMLAGTLIKYLASHGLIIDRRTNLEGNDTTTTEGG